jgi:hypothetical protein
MELFQIIQIFISMRLDIDDLIMFMEKFIGSDKLEMGEQEGEAAAPSSDSGGSTTSASPMKKWESGRTFGKTYMNDPKYKWESGRTLGKTYMNDPKYKWESGVTRSHANPVP